MALRPRRTLLGLGATCALVSGFLVQSTVTTAEAAPASHAPCPDAFPAGDLTEGQEVEGLTVTRGTTPEAFTGTYYDTVDQGIGRGRDLLIFKLEGSRITKTDGSVDAGVWQGISGSPVYDKATGQLVGAVSYGRTESNDVLAGVTPAQYMYDELLPVGPASLRLPASTRAALADDGIRTSPTTTLDKLSSPRLVSGVSQRGIGRIAPKAGQGSTRFRSGPAAAATGPALPIVPGGNAVASSAYGDLTLASVGSVTAVCGDDVIAFGHPDEFTGPSTATLHGARALAVHHEAGFGSFKDVSQIGAPAGSVLQDRLEGLSGTLTSLPVTVPVTSTTTRTGKAAIPGRTFVTDLRQLPLISAFQAYTDTATALNAETGGGEAIIRWTIDLTRADGRRQTFSRAQQYSTRQFLAEHVTSDVAGDVATIQENDFEDAKVTGITFSNAVRPQYREYRIARVERRVRHGVWQRVKDGQSITIPRGQRFKLRVHLEPKVRSAKLTPRRKTLDFPVSRYASGSGVLSIAGNAFSFDDFDEYGDYDDIYFDDEDDFGAVEAEPESLDELLAELRAVPRQTDVTSSFSYRLLGQPRTSNRTWRLPTIVSGGVDLRVRIR